MRQVDFLRVAWHAARRQRHRIARRQLDRATGDVSHAQLGALQVAQDGERAAFFLRNAAHIGDAAHVRSIIAVGKVDARHVHTSAHHVTQNIRRITRWAESTDNFRSRHIPHLIPPRLATGEGHSYSA